MPYEPFTEATSISPASFSTSLFGSEHEIVAEYYGDGNYAASTSTAAKMPGITLSSSDSGAVYGEPLTYTASIDAAGATGSVGFYDNGTLLGSSSVSNGTATWTESPGRFGHWITAEYSGDWNFIGNVSGTMDQEVAQAATVTGVTSSSSTSVFGTDVTFTASAGGSGTWYAGGYCWFDPATGTDVGWDNSADVAEFTGPAGVVTVSGQVQARSIIFDTSGYSLQGGTIELPSSGMSVGGGSATIDSTISGGGALTLTSGELALGGSNTYSGGTTITGGVLQLDGDTALGNSAYAPLTIDGGELDLNGHSITVASLGSDGGGPSGTITDANTTAGATTTLTVDQSVGTTFSGSIQDGQPRTLALVKHGSGVLALTGASTYTGGTTINGGVLEIDRDLALGAVPSTATTNLTFAGSGILQADTSFVLSANRGVAIDSGVTGTIDTNGYSVTIAGAVNGAGSLATTGSGTVVLAATNSYSGGTEIGEGTLEISSDSALGSVPGAATTNLTFAGSGILQADTSFVLNANRGVAINSGVTGTIDTQGNSVTIAGPVSGAGSLVTTGSGTAILGATNSYNGGTTIENGVLEIDSDLALGSVPITPTTSLTFTGSGVLRADRSLALSVNRGIVIDNHLTIDTNGYRVTIAGAVSGDGSLTQTGSGTLVLTAANTYGGGTTIGEGTLEISDDSALGAVPTAAATDLTFARTGVLQAGGNFTLNANRGVNIGDGVIAAIPGEAENALKLRAKRKGLS